MSALDAIFRSDEAQFPLQPDGVLFVIRCMPDPFTGEVLNVGVCATDNSGRRKGMVIQAPGRLECLYGDQASRIVTMAQVALDAATKNRNTPTEQIIFGAPQPYYNMTLDQAVARAFAEQVTVALPHKEPTPSTSIKDEEATKLVIDAIKSLRGLQTEWVANTPHSIINTKHGALAVNVPLQPVNGAGIIRSAAFSPATVRLHLLLATSDLDVLQRHSPKPIKSTGLFVLRNEAAPSDVLKKVDDAIDEATRRSPAHIHWEVAYAPEALAERAADWAASLG